MNVLVTGARAPIAADIASVLIAAGHRVWLSDSLAYPVSAACPGIQGYLRLPAPARDFEGFRAALDAVCELHAIERIVPTSEEVFWLAQTPASSVSRAFPSSETLATLHHKGNFARLANDLGYGTGTCHELSSRAALAAFLQQENPKDFVFKRAFSRFATQVLLSPCQDQLLELEWTTGNPWIAQPRVYGKEVCTYNVCQDGRVLLHVAYRPKWRAGAGASIYFEPVQNPALLTMAQAFAAATKVTGQLSFDVMESAGGLVALECNPRGTSGVHLAAQAGQALAESLLGTAEPTRVPLAAAPRMLALPLLLYHPGLLLTKAGRKAWASSKDAPTCAGITFLAQARATLELLATAHRHHRSMLEASTLDFEWNGSRT